MSLLQIAGTAKDLGGGFLVRRLLPDSQRRTIGPFVFFDHFGPVTVTPGAGHDVRPHPHIGLATVTYLFEGAIQHRDNLGYNQTIAPGAINWMTAGRGIVHSERRPDALRQATSVNHGIQLWVALPQAHEEDEPSFVHTPASAIPEVHTGGAQVRVLVGSAFGQTSPVRAFANTVYLDLLLSAGATLDLPPLAEELALYTVDAGVLVNGESVPEHRLVVLSAGATSRIETDTAARLMVLGGDALDAPRFVWWNFVSSRKERIVQAAHDWESQRMGQIPGETEFIPLPKQPLPR
jgi:redox-sensitive bicupin YhaK (pirin superfamily)